MSVENREIRGLCLQICERAQPYGASFRTIEETLADVGFHLSPAEVKAHLQYLHHKGYLHLEEVEKHGVKRRINYITPKGVDLLEGNIPSDPGVMISGQTA